MIDPYEDREQTKAKHFILKSYLQALAFKIFHFSDLTYVDGFSGPWEARTDDLSDTSPIIAIHALQEAQEQLHKTTGRRHRVRCFFSEADADVFVRLEEAVSIYNSPENFFEIKTFHGKFEDAISEIQAFSANSFALIFIDPKGWTGYSFDKIKPLFSSRKSETIINFMYSFVRRFIDTSVDSTTESLNPILGGPGWRGRLDPNIPRGEAVVELFRKTLKTAGKFQYVAPARIDKPTEDRAHFYIVYATKSYAGLKTFREIEDRALRKHAIDRAGAKERKREASSKIKDLFSDNHSGAYDAAFAIDHGLWIAAEKSKAEHLILDIVLNEKPIKFENLAPRILEVCSLKESNVKDIIVELEKLGKLERTWGNDKRKPSDSDLIFSNIIDR